MNGPLHSPPGEPLRVEWGVAFRTLPGQSESGDQYLVEEVPDGRLFAVVDGLGHGAEAAAAARTAIAILKKQPEATLLSHFRRCHDGLQKTRGAVMTLAAFNSRDNSLSWMGVGNVEGLLRRAAAPDGEVCREGPMLRGGVVGYQLPSLFATIIPVHAGDTLALYTDGIRFDFTTPLLSSADSPQMQADRILAAYGGSGDDALVLVARFTGGPSHV